MTQQKTDEKTNDTRRRMWCFDNGQFRFFYMRSNRAVFCFWAVRYTLFFMRICTHISTSRTRFIKVITAVTTPPSVPSPFEELREERLHFEQNTL